MGGVKDDFLGLGVFSPLEETGEIENQVLPGDFVNMSEELGICDGEVKQEEFREVVSDNFREVGSVIKFPDIFLAGTSASSDFLLSKIISSIRSIVGSSSNLKKYKLNN
jgi:hypothetical protein